MTVCHAISLSLLVDPSFYLLYDCFSVNVKTIETIVLMMMWMMGVMLLLKDIITLMLMMMLAMANCLLVDPSFYLLYDLFSVNAKTI